MRILLDTNLLVRMVHVGDPDHLIAVEAVAKLIYAGEDLVIAPQNLIEFSAVATRPAANNGLGKSQVETERIVAAFETRFAVVPETPDIFSNWKYIVAQSQVLGKQVHDARLVAVAVSAGVNAILTFNTAHFQRLCAASRLKLLDPRSV